MTDVAGFGPFGNVPVRTKGVLVRQEQNGCRESVLLTRYVHDVDVYVVAPEKNDRYKHHREP